MRHPPSLPALAALGVLSACSRPAPPALQPEGARLVSIDAQGMALEVEVSATNPNQADLTATGVTSRVVLDKTRDMGTITLPQTITLPGGKTTRLDLPVSLKWTDVGVLAQVAATSGGVPYSVDGTLELGGKLAHVGVPFHIDGVISHEQLVGAAMKSLPRLPF